MLAIRAFRRLNAFSERRPRVVATVAGALFCSIGDSLAQRIERGKEVAVSSPEVEGSSDGGGGGGGRSLSDGFDVRRNALVSLYGACAANFFWHPVFAAMEARFGNSGAASLAKKVLVMNALAIPLFDIPAFHFFALAPRIGLDAAASRLRENYANTVLAGLSIWVPATALGCSAMVPVHFRVPFLYMVDAAWACALSLSGNAAH